MLLQVKSFKILPCKLWGFLFVFCKGETPFLIRVSVVGHFKISCVWKVEFIERLKDSSDVLWGFLLVIESTNESLYT